MDIQRELNMCVKGYRNACADRIPVCNIATRYRLQSLPSTSSALASEVLFRSLSRILRGSTIERVRKPVKPVTAVWIQCLMPQIKNSTRFQHKQPQTDEKYCIAHYWLMLNGRSCEYLPDPVLKPRSILDERKKCVEPNETSAQTASWKRFAALYAQQNLVDSES